jgi:hypothetical protein
MLTVMAGYPLDLLVRQTTGLSHKITNAPADRLLTQRRVVLSAILDV